MGLPAWVKSRGSDTHNYFVFVEEIITQVGAGPGVWLVLASRDWGEDALAEGMCLVGSAEHETPVLDGVLEVAAADPMLGA